MEAILLCLLLNKLHFFSLTQHRLKTKILIKMNLSCVRLLKCNFDRGHPVVLIVTVFT